MLLADESLPMPTKEDRKRYSMFVKGRVEPKETLDLIVNRPVILQLAFPAKRVQAPDEQVLSYELITPSELSLTGNAQGTTVLNIWFTDPDDPKKEVILSYLVRVRPARRVDPREAQQRQIRQLQEQINHAFPESAIHLTLVGNRVVLSGQAKDRPEADAIVDLVQRNAPGGFETLSPGQAGVNLTLVGDDFREGALERALTRRTGNVQNLLRVPGERQVLLRVTVAEVNRTAARSIGINFSIFNNQGLNVFAQLTGNIGGVGVGGSTGAGGGAGVGGGASGAGASGAGGATNNLPTVLDNGQIIAAVNALRTLNFARSLAEPTLVAIDGQAAQFQAGGTFPIPVVTGTTLTGLQGVQFVPFGVELTFVPSISDKDRIRLQVSANVSTRNPSLGTFVGGGGGSAGSFVPGTNTRNFNTAVELREGQTMAVAGLISTNFGADASRVPLLGDLPYIGRFWGFDRTSAGEQELVILVTPELVHPLDPRECPPLPGADLFEPGDVEFYLLGRLESHRPSDYRSPVMNDMDRMIRHRHCEQLFIFGPQGHSDGRH